MDFSDPHFAEPGWLWLAVLGPTGLLLLQWHAARSRTRQVRQIASARFLSTLMGSVSPARRRFKNLLLLLALAGVGLALARPQWGHQPGKVQTASEDVLFLLDASRSMLAEDVRPNRLERAKLATLDFLDSHPSGRFGLVVFAGQAFLQCPLTFDHEAFRESLLAVDANTIPVGGTDLGRAMSEALHAVENPDDQQIMILLSDGEDLEETGLDVAKRVRDTNVVLYAVGIGTVAGAEIPIQDAAGQRVFLRDEVGRTVRTHLDEEVLRRIAESTGGLYQPLGALGEGLVEIQLKLHAARSAGEQPATGTGVDRFQFPLACALGLLVVESLVGTRRPSRNRGGVP
jgi:Ca-activated chloride channel family protein